MVITRLKAFIGLIEIERHLGNLFEKQNDFIDRLVSEISNHFLQAGGVHLPRPRIGPMKHRDDYIAVVFNHDIHDFRLDIHNNQLVIIKSDCIVETLTEFLRLAKDIPNIFYRTVADVLETRPPLEVSDYFHRFVVVLRLKDQDKFNYDVLKKSVTYSDQVFSTFAIKEIFRLDVNLTFSSENANLQDRAVVLKLEAPGNERNKLLFLTVELKPYPIERLATRLDLAAIMNKKVEMIGAANDFLTSFQKGFQAVFVGGFLPKLLPGDTNFEES